MTTVNEGEAAVIRAALEAEGIRTWQHVADGASLGVFGASGMNPATIRVRKSDLERALQTLDIIRQDSVDLDWNEVDVGHPEDALAARIADRDRLEELGAPSVSWSQAATPAIVWLAIIFALLILTGWLGAMIAMVFAGVDVARRVRLGLKYGRRQEQ